MVERHHDSIERIIGLNDIRVGVSTSKGKFLVEQRELDITNNPTEFFFRFEFTSVEEAIKKFKVSSVAWGATANLCLSASLLSCTTGIVSENFHFFTRLLFMGCGYSLFQMGVNTLNYAQYDIKTLSTLNKYL